MNETMVDSMQKTRLDEMCEQIAAGLAQLKRDEGISGKQVFDELRQKSQQWRQESAQLLTKSSMKSE